MVMVTRHELDESRYGRQYGELRLFVRVPKDQVNERTPQQNSIIWTFVDEYVRWNLRNIQTKGEYLHGHVNGCEVDEVLVTLQVR